MNSRSPSVSAIGPSRRAPGATASAAPLAARGPVLAALCSVLLAGCVGVVEDEWAESGAAQAQDEGLTSAAALHAARVVGAPKAVFSYPAQSCMPKLGNELGDRADMAARAIVDAAGKIQLYSGYFDMYRMEGTSFDSLVRKCDAPVHVSPNDPDYSTHRSREWLQAFYTRDGRDVSAIASVDWNGFWYSTASVCKDLGSSPPGNLRCWWNKLTAFRSTDGGRSFQTSTGRYANAPVAVPPGVPGADPDQGGRTGFFHVTNVLKDPRTGHYYFFTLATGSRKDNVNQQQDGLCLMRAWSGADLGNPNSWHSWSNTPSSGSQVSYPRNEEACQPVAMPKGLGSARFLGYSTFYRKYLMISGSTDGEGFSFAVSDNLHVWPSESYKVPFYAGKELQYLTLLDPGYAELAGTLDEPEAARRERRNFDVVGRQPSLFFVEKSPSGYPVLKRVALEFTR